MTVILAASITLIAQGYYPNYDSYGTQNNRSGWGVKGGMNIAKFDGDDADGFDSKKGFVFGFFKDTHVNQNSSIQWELLYSMKGASYEFEYYFYKQISTMKADFNFNYLELPVFYKFKLAENPTFSPNIYFGGAAAYNIVAEVELSFEGESETENYDDYTSELDFGLVVGGGFEILVKDGALIFDVRYNHGLTSVIDEEDAEVYNRVWSLTVGYGF